MTQTANSPESDCAGGSKGLAAAKNYVFREPSEPLSPSAHFSSLLLSGSPCNTVIELSILIGLATAAQLPNTSAGSSSMPLSEVVMLFWSISMLRRLYTAYLEAVWFSCPQYRTQPPREHALKQAKDLCGREWEQMKTIERHDRVTMLTQFGLELAFYYFVPGFYPAKQPVYDAWHIRLGRLIVNHYILSFGMYWMHRYLHVNPWLWKNIHSYHHWARHPLSRNTYEDHWADNFANAVVGHGLAQMVMPLDNTMFWASRVLRVMESLEKHSGVSCWLNLAHAAQRWLPFAQMPHHHDWHHEGHKGCNYTFTSLGGLWDCVFGTRKMGRADRQAALWATWFDTWSMTSTQKARLRHASNTHLKPGKSDESQLANSAATIISLASS